ncbi:MAG: hypothetical protein JNJ88_00425 [Planctomycetes bacterium]|nr:hypothetical protein [Planctomycetota bacterium]
MNLLALLLAAQLRPDQWVPTTPTYSATRHSSATVLAEDRNGVGPAQYVVVTNGQIRWRKTLPFTLYSLSLNDDGDVWGWGRHSRWWESADDKEDTFIVLLSRDGRVRVHRPISLGRRRAEMMHAPTVAAMSGVTFDGSNRLLVRSIEGVTPSGLHERWELWIVEPSGELERKEILPLERAATAVGLPGITPGRSHSLGSCAVPGTPLTFTAWMLREQSAPSPAPAQVIFGLFDVDGSLVWSLLREAGGAETVAWRPMGDEPTWAGRSAIGGPGHQAGRFYLIDPAEQTMSSQFQAVRSSGEWAVSTVKDPFDSRAARASWKDYDRPETTIPIDGARVHREAQASPIMELESLGRIPLDGAQSVALGHDRRIAALCRDGRLRIYDPQGTEESASAIPFEIWTPGNLCRSLSIHRDSSVWIVYATKDPISPLRAARWTATGARLSDRALGARKMAKIVADSTGAPWLLSESRLAELEPESGSPRVIQNGPYNFWIHNPAAVAFGNDRYGRESWVLLVPPSELSSRDHRWSGLSLHNHQGNLSKMFELPLWATPSTNMAFDGSTLVVENNGGSYAREPGLVIFGGSTDKPRGRLSSKGRLLSGTPFFAERGAELWIFSDGAIERYRAPSAQN